jgi:hypothetical protein
MTDLDAAIAALVAQERARDQLRELVGQLADRERLPLAELVAYSRKLMRACINDPARFIPRDVQRDMRRAMR